MGQVRYPIRWFNLGNLPRKVFSGVRRLASHASARDVFPYQHDCMASKKLQVLVLRHPVFQEFPKRHAKFGGAQGMIDYRRQIAELRPAVIV